MITFGLPDQQTREEIAAQYAKHLAKSDLAAFAKVTEESIKVMMESGCEEMAITLERLHKQSVVIKQICKLFPQRRELGRGRGRGKGWAWRRRIRNADETYSKSLIHEVQRWGGLKQKGVSLKYMMEFGSTPTLRNLLISAQFLHKELPARIARRTLELETLPYGLSLKPAVLKVRDWYLDSFRDLRSFPEINNTNDELEFTQMIKMIKVRHNNVVPMMALGVQLKKSLGRKIDYRDLDEIHQFLDRFYMSRIGIRMLIGQHVALHDPNPPPDCVGYIHTKMSPVQVARTASEDALAICLREYGSAPDVNIYGDPKFTFPYVPTHLHLMVFELVKNSLRAVQERFIDSDKAAPPIRIIVADGIEDVTIKACVLLLFFLNLSFLGCRPWPKWIFSLPLFHFHFPLKFWKHCIHV
ncbi:hypothetical protein LOK49_LG06G02759 [Camellia lanceoleosa]|uniref:Uncharacterized protein n=1 Tax=Camellia lanceoleosa TaxID=1840588 RepID=A0ACC0HBT5_9ERIC|nr:hypothetical protein LOK49_LG06G02759 [Camellia lanceoleosa]